MKTMIVAALAGLTLGMGVASAQGLPPGASPQVYGSAWAAGQLAAERAANAAVPAQGGQSQTHASAANTSAGG